MCLQNIIVLSGKSLSSLVEIDGLSDTAYTQAWKFGGNDRFFTASFPSLIKDGHDNSFPQIHLHNTNGFFEDLTGKYFYNKLHFLHTNLPTLHKRACFSTAIPPLSIYLECSPAQCVIKK